MSSEGVGAEDRPALLVFDPAYDYQTMVDRQLLTNVTSRTTGGFFSYVWSVHPIASLLLPEEHPERYGVSKRIVVNDHITIIEGKIGRFRFLRKFDKINFILAQLSLIVRILWETRRRKIGLVRSEEAHYGGLLAHFFSWWKNVPAVLGMFGNFGEQRLRTKQPLSPRLFPTVEVEEKFEGAMLRRADCVLVQNEDNRQFVIRHGVDPRKTAIFRMGNLLHPVHFTKVADRPDGRPDLDELGIPPNLPVLMNVTRLEAIKYPQDVVIAAKHLKDLGHDFRVLLVGDGTMRDELLALAAQLDVSEQLVLCGNRDQFWIARVAPLVSCVITPGMGRALAELALAECPVAGYDYDWHPELIETGVTGELTPYLDPVALAEAAARFLDDPVYARRMGAAIRERVFSMMSPAVVERDQARIYARIMGEAEPRDQIGGLSASLAHHQ